MNLKYFLLVTLLFSGIQTATANTGKLPFVGTRDFAFGMAIGYAQQITISKNGNVSINAINLSTDAANSEAPYNIVIYKGKYKTLMPSGEKGVYYHIRGNKISLVNKHKKVLRNCEDNVPIMGSSVCTSTLHKD